MTRRRFIGQSAGTAAAIMIGSSVKALPVPFDEHLLSTGFEQAPLPYAFDSLEPLIDRQTMEIHYGKHASAYCKNLNEAAQAEAVLPGETLRTILSNISRYSTKMRNNGGGHFNHEMFWACMKPVSPGAHNMPAGQLAAAIQKSFGSYDSFKSAFSSAALSRFGSGWAWLYVGSDRQLHIGSTPNQDNPLMDIAEIRGEPILALDVWEHAYYLKYQNKRADYINNWWALVNWDYVAERFSKI